jgi:hypothetical protein
VEALQRTGNFMKLKIPMLFLLSLWLFSGAMPQQNPAPPRDTETPRSVAASAAVMLSLDEFFSGNWGLGTVYIQSDPLIPSGLNQVGRYKAQVISVEALKELYAGKETAPAMASVTAETVQEKGEWFYSVFVSYNGVQVKGASRIPLGGAKTYLYKIHQGQAVLLKTSSLQF